MSSFGITQDAAAASTPASSDEKTASADDLNPYAAIIRANVFHLTDPPKPAEKQDQALLSLPKVNISGFLRHSDQPIRALFATVPKDPKEMPRYFNLAEGEKEDILQVTKIYANQESVDVIIAGTPMTLTTKSNSFVQPLPPPPKGGLPNPGVVAYHPPVQQAAPAQTPYSGGVVVAGGGMAAPNSGSSVTTIGSNGGAAGFNGGSSGFGGQSLASTSAANGNSALRSIPTRGSPLPSFPPEYQPQSVNESHIIMAVDTELHQPEIQNQNYPPPPPLQ